MNVKKEKKIDRHEEVATKVNTGRPKTSIT